MITTIKNNGNKEKETLPMMNEEITFPEVRCVGDDGKQYGVISTIEALKLATELSLDLVVIAETGIPPVVKLMNYSKFKYQEEKRKKEAKKNQKTIVIKEIKLSVKIAENDISFKVKHALEFLEKGFHVRFKVFLKGREMGNPESAKDVLLDVWERVKDAGIMEKTPFLESRYYTMVVVPNSNNKK